MAAVVTHAKMSVRRAPGGVWGSSGLKVRASPCRKAARENRPHLPKLAWDRNCGCGMEMAINETDEEMLRSRSVSDSI